MARSRAAYEYTEAEDKSIRLGFLLIAAGLLSLLGLGCCWLRPALQERGGGGSANCTVLAVRQLGERFPCTFSCGAACRGTARYPCLQVLVRTSRSSAPALLHEDERQLRNNPKPQPQVILPERMPRAAAMESAAGPRSAPPAAPGGRWEAGEKLLLPARGSWLPERRPMLLGCVCRRVGGFPGWLPKVQGEILTAPLLTGCWGEGCTDTEVFPQCCFDS